ncbi:hypothetical protein OSB04_007692 [Centaurea solstitialis]|uniref:UDP-glycosyltransferase n=1 Tax=Centaurea solstitialis TaxID=347529 RepID=A0AA38WIT3_9ASTR|nr:hypothetical protein OSB04_007692 [Centaurea solstitialis]
MDEMKPHVVLIPLPAQSHIKCMLKLATLLHHHGLHITFINTHSNHTRLLGSAAAHRLHRAPRFQFRSVPDGLPSTNSDGGGDAQEPIDTLWQVVGYLTTNFLGSFLELVAGVETPVTSIISDGFMTFARTPLAAEKLGVPIILFWTMAACGFMGFYQAKVLMERGIVPLEDESHLKNGYLDTMVDIAGMKEIRLKDLPEHVLGLDDPTESVFSFMVETAKEADKHSHVIIHTFDELETNLIKELKSMFPKVYTVGPLQLLLNQIIPETEPKNSNLNGYSLWTEEPECVKWLESKEPNSVVYVNFGSLAIMSLQDLLEFGWGLINSKYYFLWIIRSDLVDGKSAALPEELKEVVTERGFIASWCSQEEVLSHSAVGGFLTHGGWGSVIESLSSGVPMMCWPFTGDQRMNCRQMCKDWEVGMEIGRSVTRDEVEKVVRVLMAGDEGRRMRTKAIEWQKMAEIAAGSNVFHPCPHTTNIKEMDEKKPHVVLIPYPAQSHIKCMLKLATLLHHHGLQITFINTHSNHTRLLSSAAAHPLDGAPGFQFRSVPDGLLATNSDGGGGHQEPIRTLWQVNGYLATNFLDSFLEVVARVETPVTCIISDGFMTFARTPLAAEKLGVPIILFWTMAACGFMGFYQAKALMDRGLSQLKVRFLLHLITKRIFLDESHLTNGYLDTMVDIPGMKEIRLKDLPEHVLGIHPIESIFSLVVEASIEANKHAHVIIHTFDELETNLIKELKSIFTKVYTVGPLQLLLNQIIPETEPNNSNLNGYSLWTEEPECIKWLESKEPNSVVYINFGSLAIMSLQDLLEFGWGLVNSEHYFLWIIRSDLIDGKSAVLPAELEEVVKERGFIAVGVRKRRF